MHHLYNVFCATVCMLLLPRKFNSIFWIHVGIQHGSNNYESKLDEKLAMPRWKIARQPRCRISNAKLAKMPRVNVIRNLLPPRNINLSNLQTGSQTGLRNVLSWTYNNKTKGNEITSISDIITILDWIHQVALSGCKPRPLITSFPNERGINNITKRPGIESPTWVWVLFERAI